MKDIINSIEAAQILDVSITTVGRWDVRGILTNISHNKRKKYLRSDVEKLLEHKPNFKKGLREYDIIGKKFGMLTVIERAEDHQTRQSWWKCKCDCGNVCEVKGHRLVRNHTRSCGCLKSSIPSPHYKGCGDLSGSYWRRVLRHAKNRNLEVVITIEEAWKIFEQQKGRCALSKMEIKLHRNSHNLRAGHQTASLDRIDSSRGYHLDNIQWVHKDVQKIKMNFPEERFLFLCQQMSKNKDFPAHNYEGCGDLSGSYWSRIKKRAKERNLKVTISIREAWETFEKQQGLCALSKMEIKLNRTGRQTASLDRIDSSRGYHLDNIQWVHKDVQKMKMNFPEERFLFLCQKITEVVKLHEQHLVK